MEEELDEEAVSAPEAAGEEEKPDVKEVEA